MRKKVALVTCLAMLGASRAFGTQIGVQVSWNSFGQNLSPTDTAGVVPQTNFNVLPDYAGYRNNPNGDTNTSDPTVSGNLTAADGSSTNVTLTMSGHESASRLVQQGGLTPNNRLIDNVDDAGSEGTYTFANVPDGTYDVYVYTPTDSSPSKEAISIGAQSFYLAGQFNTDTNPAGNATFTDFIQGTNDSDPTTFNVANYVEFQNVSPVAGNLVITATNLGGNNTSVSGFQLVPVAAPEPSVVGVLGLGVTALLGRRRKASTH